MPLDTSDALRSLTVTLSAVRHRLGSSAIQGLADPLVIADPTHWTPATALTDGTALPALLGVAQRRWNAAPHAAATLAWKSYSYWLAMPAVLSWAAARRVPLVDDDNVLVRFGTSTPMLQLGLRNMQLAVLPDDPLAHSGPPDIIVVSDEKSLLQTLRTSLFDRHLDLLAERIHTEVKVGRRTLLGSVASGIAYAVIRAGHALPGSTTATVQTLLDALELSDLVELIPSAVDEPGVKRRTCCLAFTLPQPQICSGCCLR